MAYPTKPDIDYSYEGFQTEQQINPFPGTQLDNDLAELKRGIDDTIDALGDVRREDGSLPNGIVTYDSLDAGAKVALKGVKGDAGDPFTIADAVSAVEDLPISAEPNEGYFVGTVLYVYDSDEAEWTALADLAGPAGAAGADGSNGADGANGSDGADGADGATIIRVTTTPSSGQGSPGDYAINDAGVLYQKTDETTWAEQFSLKGPTGDTGPQGPQGDPGAGDMESATYDPGEVGGDAFDMDNMVEGADAKVMTSAERDAIAALGSAAQADTGDFATAAQGALADSAIQPAALAAVQVPAGGATGQLLKKASAADNDVEWGNVSGTGDVEGPSSSTDGAIVAFDSTSGKLLKESGVQLSEIARATPTPPTFAYRFKEGQPLPNAFSLVRDDATSCATRLARSGLTETVAANVLRHHYAVDGAYLGALTENEAENLATYSNDLTQWTKGNCTITSDAVGSPIGLIDKIVVNADTAKNHYVEGSQSVTNGDICCWSALAKKAEYSWLYIVMTSGPFGSSVYANFDLDSGVIGTVSSGATANMVDMGDGVYRCSVGKAATATDSTAARIYVAEANNDVTFDGDGSSGIYAGGLQFEKGRLTPSSYVATTSTAVTREADNLTADIAAIEFNATEGTFYWRGAIDDTTAARGGILFARESSAAGFALHRGGSSVIFMVRDASTNETVTSAATIVAGQEFACAVYWSETEIGISVNGETPVTTARVATPTPTSLWVGRGVGVGTDADDQFQNGPTREFAVWDRALPSEITVLAARGPAIGETLYQPNVNLARWPRMSDYAPTDDTKECKPALDAFLADAARATDYEFDSPVGGSRTYRFLSRALATASPSLGVNHIGLLPSGRRGHLNADLDFSGYGKSGTRLHFLLGEGSVGTEYSLTSSGAVGDESIAMSSGDAANFAPGDIAFVRANDNFTSSYGNDVTERQYVRKVSGGTVTFYGALRDGYTTGQSARAAKITPWRGEFDGTGRIIGPGRFTGDNAGDYGFKLAFADGARVSGIEAVNCDFQGIIFDTCFNTIGRDTITRQEDEGDGTNTQVQYGATILDGCENTFFHNHHAYGGKHGMVQTPGGVRGVTRNSGFIGGTVQGTWHNGVATHTNGERFIVTDVVLENCAGGIDTRVERVVVARNTVRDLFRTTSISTGALGTGITIRGRIGWAHVFNNVIENGIYGIRYGTSETAETGPFGINIHNNEIRVMTFLGCEIYYDDTTDAKFDLHIVRNHFYAITSYPIRVYGKFQSPVASFNTFDGGPGTGYACVYFHGPTSHGSINVDASYNRYRGYNAPLVTQSSGTTTTTGNLAL